MKTLKFLLACAVALVVFVECSSEEEPLPYLWVSASKIEVPYYGGTYDFSYAATPEESWAVEVESSVEWITDVTVSSENVSFSVPYTTLSSRTGYIYIIFSGDEGVYSWRVTVSQDAGVTPTVETQSASITTTIAGGTYEVDYSIINPTPDGEISITTDEDWISNIDRSADGLVSFSVAENDGDALREANINIFYTYSEGESNVTVKIIQPFNSGGSFNGTAASIIGTYEVEGIGFNFIDLTWTMVITEEDGALKLGKMLGVNVDATLKPEGEIVIPSKLYQRDYSSAIFGGLVAFLGNDNSAYHENCTGYKSGGLTYWWNKSNCVFTYIPETDSWESDKGLWYAYFTDNGMSSITSMNTNLIIYPNIKIKRTSDSVSTSINNE